MKTRGIPSCPIGQSPPLVMGAYHDINNSMLDSSVEPDFVGCGRCKHIEIFLSIFII